MKVGEQRHHPLELSGGGAARRRAPPSGDVGQLHRRGRPGRSTDRRGAPVDCRPGPGRPRSARPWPTAVSVLETSQGSLGWSAAVTTGQSVILDAERPPLSHDGSRRRWLVVRFRSVELQDGRDMYVAVVDVDEPAVVPVDGQRVDIDQLRVEVAQTRPRVGGAGLEPRLGSSGRVNGGRSDQDGLNCVDRVRRYLGVAVGTAAGRWWAGTLRHWPLLGAFHGALPQAAN